MIPISKLASPLHPASSGAILRVFAIRKFASAVLERPPKAKIQLKPPPGEKGYMNYERDFSRESRYTKPHKKTDTFIRFVTFNARHHMELWPIVFLCGVSCCLVVGIAYISFEKVEVWLDRSTKTPPWDWARIRDKYWRMQTVFFDPLGGTHQRIEIMEKLQDEMLEAAKQRGTRDAGGYIVTN